MKTNYTIKNFRAFDRKGARIEISPLTFLVGCNSSGKSSFVKSLFLLKEFFERKTPVIGTKIDFSTYPIYTLGTFRNAVHSSSKDKTITISYDKYSVYLNDTVTTSLSIREGALGNGFISSIQIKKKDGTVLIDVSDSARRFLHSSALKKYFKKFLVAARIISIIDWLEFEILMEKEDSPRRIKLTKEIEKDRQVLLKSYSQDYLDKLYDLYKAINPGDSYQLFGAAPFSTPTSEDETLSSAQFLSTDIMMYFPILHELHDVNDVDKIREILHDKVRENSKLSDKKKERLFAYIEAVCKDYRQSHKKSFMTYYRSLEDDFIDYDSPRFFEIIKSREDFADYIDLFELSPEFIHGEVYRADSTLSQEEPEIVPGIVLDRFGTVHGLLDYLSPENPFSYLPSHSSYKLEPSKTARHAFYLETFKEYIEVLLKEILCTDVTENLDYISSSRIQVRRMYPMEDNTEFISSVKRYYDIENKFLALNPPITIIESSGKWGYEPKYTKHKVNDFMPGAFMNKWVKAFKIGDHLSLEMDRNGLGLLVKLFNTPSDKNGKLLADMGYGITQFLSIVLQIETTIMSSLYDCFKGKTASDGEVNYIPIVSARTIAIEEPEIHLHPKCQSLLAEMFYEAYKEYNIQFIIETHSEYLLRKIQTLVGTRNLSPEEVSMVYVEEDDEVKKGASKVRRIPIKEDGRLATPFGPGFYDEADNLSLELFTKMGR